VRRRRATCDDRVPGAAALTVGCAMRRSSLLVAGIAGFIGLPLPSWAQCGPGGYYACPSPQQLEHTCEPGTFPGGIGGPAENACSENSFKFYEQQGCATLAKQPPGCYKIEFNNNTLRFHQLQQNAFSDLRRERRDKFLANINAQVTLKVYKLISLSDLHLDSSALVKSGTKIALFGRYIKLAEDTGFLIEPYIYEEDVFTSAASLHNKIPIVAGGAAREFRKLLLNLPTTETEQGVLLGTPTNLVVIGRAIECAETNQFGVQVSAICFGADDGWKVAGFGE